MNKFLFYVVSASLATSLLFTGCTDRNKTGESGQGEPAGKPAPAAQKVEKVPIPEREATDTKPVETVDFQGHKVNLYEYTGADISMMRTGKLAVTGDAIYFYGSVNDPEKSDAKHKATKSVLFKVGYNKETIKDPVQIAEANYIYYLSNDGKGAIYKGKDKDKKLKLGYYDGKEGKYLEELDGNLFACDPETGYIFYDKGNKLVKAKFNAGQISEPQDIIDDCETKFGRKSLTPLYADSKAVFCQTEVEEEKDGEKIEHKQLMAFDHNGNLLCTYDGLTELPRGWAVTTNYVVHSGSKGDLRIFDRQTGKELESIKLNIRPFLLCTVKGNDVLVYDDRADKIYRLDL